MESSILIVGLILSLIGIISIVFLFKKRKSIILDAEQTREDILKQAENEVVPFHERIERLKVADKEITARLKLSRETIEDITGMSPIN